MSDLAAAWTMGNEANLFLLGHLREAQLVHRYAPRTRTVGEQFAHLHAVRLRWLGVMAPDLAEGLMPLPKEGLTPAALARALRASARAVGTLLERAEAQGRLRAWKGPPATFLGYLVAHEAHHRGLALVALRVAGEKVPQEVVYGLWNWGK